MSTGTPKATEICVALTSKADHDSAPHSLYDEHSDAAHGNCFWFPWGGVFVFPHSDWGTELFFDHRVLN